MKKLMIAAAVVLAGIAANAANVKWMTGAVQTPLTTEGHEGELSGSKLTSASGYVLKMFVWESLVADDVAHSAGDLYNWYAGGQTGTPLSKATAVPSANVTINMTASATTGTAEGTVAPATDGNNVYGAILFVLEDTDGNAKWYMENDALKASGKSTVTMGNLALKEAGTGSATTWTAAPEPTSGLLLLLGVGALALRRRRA